MDPLSSTLAGSTGLWGSTNTTQGSRLQSWLMIWTIFSHIWSWYWFSDRSSHGKWTFNAMLMFDNNHFRYTFLVTPSSYPHEPCCLCYNLFHGIKTLQSLSLGVSAPFLISMTFLNFDENNCSTYIFFLTVAPLFWMNGEIFRNSNFLMSGFQVVKWPHIQKLLIFQGMTYSVIPNVFGKMFENAIYLMLQSLYIDLRWHYLQVPQWGHLRIKNK